MSGRIAFPGTEALFLRCMIERILCSTVIAPVNFYKKSEDEDPRINFAFFSQFWRYWYSDKKVFTVFSIHFKTEIFSCSILGEKSSTDLQKYKSNKLKEVTKWNIFQVFLFLTWCRLIYVVTEWQHDWNFNLTNGVCGCMVPPKFKNCGYYLDWSLSHNHVYLNSSVWSCWDTIEANEEFTTISKDEHSEISGWVHTRGCLRLEGRLTKYIKPETDEENKGKTLVKLSVLG